MIAINGCVKMMRITIITVCFNEEKNIARTIDSVLDQTMCDFEYIICDGKSSDKTLEIVESYRDKFAEKGVDYRVYSERDGGVYFGMNNGIDRATGDYIIFTNGGDSLASENVLQEVSDYLHKQDVKPDVVYGSFNYIEGDVTQTREGDHELLIERMSVPHPASFCSADSLKKYKFNTEYRIGADYDFMLNVYLNGGVFVKIPTIVSNFVVGGISTEDHKKSLNEERRILKSHGVKFSKIQFLIRGLKIDCFRLLSRLKKAIK